MGAAIAVLAELGGEAAAQVAGQSGSIALGRGGVWGSTPESYAALLAVEEGFVLISADTCSRIGNGRPVSRRIVVATGQPGTLLAPLALGERLEALTPSRITIVSADSLKVMLGLPSVAEAIVEAFADALRERQASIRNGAYVRHSERVLEKLLQLARTYGHVVPGGVRIDFPLTHQLLADMIGSARETVSLALSKFTRDGFLRRQYRCYVLRISPHELRSLDTRSDAVPAAVARDARHRDERHFAETHASSVSH